jgi:hypothetical protein
MFAAAADDMEAPRPLKMWLVLALGWVLACSSGGASPPGSADGSARDAPGPEAPARLPGCNLRFSKSAANTVAPEVPLTGSCPGERTDDGMGHPFIDFQPVDMQAGVVRTFSIWQFQTRAPAGTVLKIEDGFDELASRGVSVRYLEINGNQTNTWRADRGTVTLVSTRDEGYTMELADAHMVPATDPFGANRATGEFEVNGTIISVLP